MPDIKQELNSETRFKIGLIATLWLAFRFLGHISEAEFIDKDQVLVRLRAFEVVQTTYLASQLKGADIRHGAESD